MGIHHIEDVAQSKLESLVQNWNSNNITVTEKMDGSYMTFGLKNDNFFIGSKNLTFGRYDQIPDIFFYDDFRKYFKILYKLPLENVLCDLEKKYNVTLPRILEGESIPSHEHNIVSYDKNKICNGVFVFFKTFEPENEELWNDLTTMLNVFSVIRFHTLPHIPTNSIKLNLQSDVKKQILENFKFNPLFGNQYEGLVLKFGDDVVKVVDKEKFNKTKEINWAYINKATKYKLQFKNKTKKNIKNIEIHLNEWLDALNKLEDEFNNGGKKTLTIRKKKTDTTKYINFCRNDIIIPLKNRLNLETPEQVFSAFLNKTYNITTEPDPVKEHNVIFKYTNSCVPKSLIEANVKQALSLIGLENLKFNVVGNNSADYSGDLDIAISKKEVADAIKSTNDFWGDLENYLSSTKVDFSILKGLRQFHIAIPLQDETGKQLLAVDKTGVVSSDLGVIQIDFFVGTPEWMIEVLSGKPQDSQYKASYRNVLLRSIFSSLSFPNDDKFTRTSIEWKDGIKFIINKINPPKSSKEFTYKEERVDETGVIYGTADGMASFLFGPKTTWQEINSFEKLFELYKSDRFQFNKFRHIINQSIIINYKESDMQIPEIINLLFSC